MADTRKPRPTTRMPAAGKTAAAGSTETKAAAEFRRFKAAGAAAAAAATKIGMTSGGTTSGGKASATSSPMSAGASGFPPPMAGLPPWAMPPSFSLPQPPQGWGGPMPQPGMLQSAPLAVGPIGDRLGSTLRLGIDVINMALAGSLRLLGGHGGHARGYGSQCGGGSCGCGCGCDSHSGADHCGGHDCCSVFERDACCTPSVGNCCG